MIDYTPESIKPKTFFEVLRTFNNSQLISIFYFKNESTILKILSCYLNLINLKWSNFDGFTQIKIAGFRIHKGLKESFLLCSMLINDIEILFLI